MTTGLNLVTTSDRSILGRWLGPVVLVAVLALAGCGSDDNTTAGTDPRTTTAPSDTPVSVAEALEIGDDDLHQVAGFAVTVDQIPRLCAALAESDPPQCGEPSIALAGEPTSNLDALFGDQLTTRNGVSWTPTPVTVTGAVITTGPSPELWVTP